MAALESAGLIHVGEDGVIAVENVFATLLAASPATSRSGVARFLHDGRVAQIPVRADARRDLLVWVRDRVLPDRVELTEREFGERLAAISSDVASLRRHLVDAGLVLRDVDGGRYRRAV